MLEATSPEGVVKTPVEDFFKKTAMLDNNHLIFEPLAMSFKNSETDTIDPYWVKHFKKLGEPVPEGEPGTNPADIYLV